MHKLTIDTLERAAESLKKAETEPKEYFLIRPWELNKEEGEIFQQIAHEMNATVLPRINAVEQ